MNYCFGALPSHPLIGALLGGLIEFRFESQPTRKNVYARDDQPFLIKQHYASRHCVFHYSKPSQTSWSRIQICLSKARLTRVSDLGSGTAI
jgi:hypothetical protein